MAKAEQEARLVSEKSLEGLLKRETQNEEPQILFYKGRSNWHFPSTVQLRENDVFGRKTTTMKMTKNEELIR